jgi:hypothetical protein
MINHNKYHYVTKQQELQRERVIELQHLSEQLRCNHKVIVSSGGGKVDDRYKTCL